MTRVRISARASSPLVQRSSIGGSGPSDPGSNPGRAITNTKGVYTKEHTEKNGTRTCYTGENLQASTDKFLIKISTKGNIFIVF